VDNVPGREARDRAAEPAMARERSPFMTLRIAVVAALLTGCTAATPADSLDGTEWISAAVTEAGADRPLVGDTEIRLSFADGRLGAAAGCNTMNGAYRVEDGRLIVEGGAMTEMGCDEPRHAQDEWVFAFLGAQPSIAREGDKLTLTAGETVIALQDREVAEPDLPLTGTTWTVDSIIAGDAVSSVPNGATATVIFSDDGTIQVDTGCNGGAGTYDVTDGTIRVLDFETTLMGCSDAVAHLEAAITGVFGPDEIEYTIDAGSLTLMAGDQGLGLRGD
jgi:heat shock protein HslJ